MPHTEHRQLLRSSSAGITALISLSKEVISPKYLLLNSLRTFPSFSPISFEHPQLRGPTTALGLSHTGIWALVHPFGMHQKRLYCAHSPYGGCCHRRLCDVIHPRSHNNTLPNKPAAAET